MSITSDGWLDWAIRLPGRSTSDGQGRVAPGFNAGANSVKGLVFHSAEGWASTMLSRTSQWGYHNATYPWHLSNLLDGRLVQHYSFLTRCWHGSAFNQEYVGMEHEGRTPDGAAEGPPLNEAQIANACHVITDLSAWKGWTPRRPTQVGDKTASLYEHREAVWFGGSSTGCPSYRIPWLTILRRLEDKPEPPVQELIGETPMIVGHPANAGDHLLVKGKLHWIPTPEIREDLMLALYRAPGDTSPPPRMHQESWDWLQGVLNS